MIKNILIITKYDNLCPFIGQSHMYYKYPNMAKGSLTYEKLNLILKNIYFHYLRKKNLVWE